MLENEDKDLEFDNSTHHASEENHKKYLARKRIDELKEQKRLKALLDDEEDWEI